jgi:hypothetical protein
MFGLMAKYTTENGTKARKKEMVFGKEFTETVTSASGKILELMVMAFTSGWAGTNTKVSGNTV